MLDYMDKCPMDERGWRPMFDIVEWHERETHQKQLFKDCRAVFMNQHQYVKFEMGKEDGLLEVDARARWDKRKREVPEEDWDYGGDNNDILELPIVTEKYVDGSKGVMHDKQMDLSGKKQKVKNMSSSSKKGGLSSLVDFVALMPRSSMVLVEVS